MTSNDTIAAQQPAVAAEPLDAADTAWLAITAGDSATIHTRPREHAWPADLYILLANLSGLGLAVGAVAMGAAIAVDLALPSVFPIGTVLMMALGSVIQFSLANHLKHFSRWGWYGAMAELAFLTLSKVATIVTEPGAMIGAGIGIAIDVLWMRYFWNRRADFDIDLDF
jgi:hypothetical protein